MSSFANASVLILSSFTQSSWNVLLERTVLPVSWRSFRKHHRAVLHGTVRCLTMSTWRAGACFIEVTLTTHCVFRCRAARGSAPQVTIVLLAQSTARWCHVRRQFLAHRTQCTVLQGLPPFARSRQGTTPLKTATSLELLRLRVQQAPTVVVD